MKKRNLHFQHGSIVRLPDFVYFVCEECANNRLAILKKNTYALHTLCDFCEKRKKNVYNKDDYEWVQYQASDVKIKKWR